MTRLHQGNRTEENWLTRMVRQAHHERAPRFARPELVEGPAIYFRSNAAQEAIFALSLTS